MVIYLLTKKSFKILLIVLMVKTSLIGITKSTTDDAVYTEINKKIE